LGDEGEFAFAQKISWERIKAEATSLGLNVLTGGKDEGRDEPDKP
jgi:hypothetical protein